MWRWILTTFFMLMFCIGPSLITIPFAVSLGGFWPSVIAIVITWVYLLLTGLYYLETTLASPPGANVFSISRRFTGIGGAWFSSLVFGIVHYTYLVFFFYWCAPILSEILFKNGIPLSQEVVLLILYLVIGVTIFLGLTFTMFFNFLLVLLSGWVIYLCFAAGYHFATNEHLKTFHWGFLFIVFPTLVNTLYFNTFFPTVAPILNYNKKLLRSSMIVGLSVAAILFIAWLWLIFATTGENNAEALSTINPQSISYSNLFKVPHFGQWLPLLLCLNIMATASGIGAVLVDFLSDMMHISLEQRRGLKRLGISALVILPPLLLNLIPTKFIFLTALYIADIGPLYLSGLLPVTWVWSLRYYFHEKVSPLVPGGRGMLIVVGVISCFIFYLVGLEIFYQSTF